MGEADRQSSDRERASISADEKTDAWAQANRWRLLFYDVVESFGPSSVPDSKRRIIGNSENREERLSNSTWRAGKEAINALLDLLRVADERGMERPVSLVELNEVLPELFKQAEAFLDGEVYPDLEKAINEGLLSTNVPLEEFRRYWAEYSMASKVETFLQLVRSNPSALYQPDVAALPRKLAALAVLEKIDDFILESLDGGPGLGEVAVEIERLRSTVTLPQLPGVDMAAVKRATLSERATVAASARHQKTNQARDWVRMEWGQHAQAYGGNKSEFSRHYARRLANERGVTVTEKTIRESWLRDTPSASKPPRLQADGG